MAKAKVNWEEHQAAFLELRKLDPLLTIKIYAERYDLPFGSAKRHLRVNIDMDTKEVLKPKPKVSKRVKDKKHGKNAIDWEEVTLQFLNQAIKTPSLTVKDFAEVEGFNYGTARRSIKKVRDSGVLEARFDLYDQKVALYKSQTASNGHKRRLSNSKGYKKSDTQGCETPQQSVRDQKRNESDTEDHQNDTYPSVRDSFGRFVHGNSASVIHGGYASLTGIDPSILDVVNQIECTSMVNEVQHARAQYISMVQFTNKSIAKIDEAEQAGEPLKDDEGKEHRNYERERGRALFGTAGRLREIEASIGGMASSIAKINHDSMKILQASMKLPMLSPAEELKNLSEILALRTKYQWTALETAQKLEVIGCNVPKTLLLEAQKEIENFEPEVDDTGVTDEELEAQTQEYLAKQREVEENWLPDRRESIERAFEEAEAEENGYVPEPSAKDMGDLNDDEYDLLDEDSLEPFDGLEEFKEL